MFLGPRQAESCRSHVQDSELKDLERHGSRSVREEALTAATFRSCVDFVRACLHPSSLAAQPPPCTRPPKTARRVRTLTARSFFAARRPRSQGRHQRQLLQASGRRGLLPQQLRSGPTSAFPTRSGAQFAMPGGSDEEEREQRTRSPPAASGGARRSYDTYAFSGGNSRGRFSTDDVPSANSIQDYWVRTRED